MSAKRSALASLGWLDEAFGQETAPDGTLKSENFERWFGDSRVVDDKGAPLLLHHGTANVASILGKGFSHEFSGQGTDQYGPGWYFTSRAETARGYELQRAIPTPGQVSDAPDRGTLNVYARILKPIVTHEERPWLEQLPHLTQAQARKLILGAPEVRDPDGAICNWGDVQRDGFELVLSRASKAYSEGGGLFNVFNDFYEKKVEPFYETLRAVTGHDGLMHKLASGEVHVVAWFPESIKSADLNNGLFDPHCSDITDGRSLHAQQSSVITRAKAAKKSVVGKSARATRDMSP